MGSILKPKTTSTATTIECAIMLAAAAFTSLCAGPMSDAIVMILGIGG